MKYWSLQRSDAEYKRMLSEENVPKTFAAFRSIKENHPDRFNELRTLYNEKIVDNSVKSDIMKLGSGGMELNREVKRRESNIGAFKNLEIPMQKRSVLSVARKYNISTEGLTFKIQRSEKLLALPFYGSTDYDHIGRIDLFPNAFINEEQLVRTIIHEKCHIKQLNKYGKAYAIENLDLMEKQAERFENLYYSILRKRVH